MALLWAALGAVVGIGTAPGQEMVDLAAGITAGVIVLLPVGLLLGLLGSQARLALLGSMAGAVFGAAVGTVVGPAGLSPVLVGLVGGAIMGGTFSVVSCLSTFLARAVADYSRQRS
jgi:hypothetical protein